MSTSPAFGVPAQSRRVGPRRWRGQVGGSRIRLPNPEPTEEEIEAVYLLSQGEAIVDIAAKFGCPRHAMVMRISRLRDLFEVSSTAELVALALRRHWIE